jgi:glycosyltransferase involved in cell wall biosynthesis
MSDSRQACILEVTSYPPPRSGWAIRVEFLKQRLERDGHRCVVLNTGASRRIPSSEYETVMSGGDLLRKLWRYSRQGFVVHAHANGNSPTGVVLALVAAFVNLVNGRRCYLTFHAGVIQRYFPPDRSRGMAPLYWLLFTIPRRIICNSEPVRACIARYGIDTTKVVPIPAFSAQYLQFTPAPLPDALEQFFERYRHVIFTYVRMRPLFFTLTLVDGFARIAARDPHAGLVLCGGTSHMEGDLWEQVQRRIAEHRLEDRICFIEDLSHDAFLTALQRSILYLRTPITDGVASSVLESLALRVPVVGSENGTRPPGVITYPAEDADEMAKAVLRVIADPAAVAAAIPDTEAKDTLTEEVATLTSHL